MSNKVKEKVTIDYVAIQVDSDKCNEYLKSISDLRNFTVSDFRVRFDLKGHSSLFRTWIYYTNGQKVYAYGYHSADGTFFLTEELKELISYSRGEDDYEVEYETVHGTKELKTTFNSYNDMVSYLNDRYVAMTWKRVK